MTLNLATSSDTKAQMNSAQLAAELTAPGRSACTVEATVKSKVDDKRKRIQSSQKLESC